MEEYSRVANRIQDQERGRGTVPQGGMTSVGGEKHFFTRRGRTWIASLELTALELFDAVQVVARIAIQSSHDIPILATRPSAAEGNHQPSP